MRTDDWPAHCDRREGYTLTTDYDLFDRVTRVTYPDQTYEALTYTAWTSRLGATVTDE